MDLPPPRYFEAYTSAAVAVNAAPLPPPLPADGELTAFGVPLKVRAQAQQVGHWAQHTASLQLSSEIIKPIEAYSFERLFAAGDYGTWSAGGLSGRTAQLKSSYFRPQRRAEEAERLGGADVSAAAGRHHGCQRG